MARNRRRRGHVHALAMVPKPVGVAFVIVVSLALVYLWIGHKCTEYSAEIKRMEDRCAELDNEKVREETQWNSMKTAEKLDSLLLRHGLQMVYPNAGQVVRMTAGSRTGTSLVAQGQPVTPRGATQVAGRAQR